MENKARSAYFDKLVDVYDALLNKLGTRRQINDEFTSRVLSLLDLQEVPIDEIERYCMNEHTTVSRALQKSEVKEVHQPASLLLFYYIEYYEVFIEGNWPFSNKLFREYKRELGLSSHY